ncbi:MAG: UDP-N-acetylmuramoyl-L-alanine--D-glutamate ligase [Planctomycetes bacterium]|nr:UDP-N-acetylmuramoyl-L-alanine--D-glutamate ligase [Planctomycetota bacterium]
MSLAGKRVTVLGLGGFGGGAAAARFLVAQGAQVTVTDLKPPEELAAAVAALDGLPVRFVLGEHRLEDVTEVDLVVKNPAIPPASGWVAAARRAGVPITSELALGLERLEAPFAMVTGSKGKSTTAGLLGAMLSAVVAGNNERPLLDALGRIGPGARVVLEVSSFMAEDLVAIRPAARLPRPRALVFTHLEPEHLNWHGTLEAYYGAKLSLLDLGPEVVVIPEGQPELEARVPPRLPPGARLVRASATRPAADLSGLRLLGRHNLDNAALAAEAALAMGAAPDEVARAAAAFEPLPHRLETVAVSPAGVRFVNDSMATTPAAALAALAAVPAPVVLLLGGSDKGHDFAALGAAAARAHAVVCLGAVRDKVAAAVEAAGGRPLRAGSFEEAFALAVERCPPGGAVLLSPAAASYDMFPSFKARGERFRALATARALPAATGQG